MEVNFAPELQEKIDRAAEAGHVSSDEYLQRLVEHYVDYDAWFRRKVQASIDQLDRGEFLTDEEVWERIDKTLKA